MSFAILCRTKAFAYLTPVALRAVISKTLTNYQIVNVRFFFASACHVFCFRRPKNRAKRLRAEVPRINFQRRQAHMFETKTAEVCTEPL